MLGLQVDLPTIDTGPFAFGDITAGDIGKPAPPYWRDWLQSIFPRLFRSEFAPHHVEFWEHTESIEPGTKPPAFFAIWARGGAKTTSAEAAVVRLGATERRKFCLYVRATQDKANESVQNIMAMLESQGIERHYPELASRKLGKYGNTKGWRVDLLRCGNGFNVVGLGLDAAVRGVKIEEFRPDLIVFDDIDDKQDSPATIEKKIQTLTTSVLPAGSTDAAVIGVQNVIHANSIFNRIAEGEADFLHNRIVSGPHPAIQGMMYESKPDGGYRITGGTPTWPAGQPLAVCEAQINEWGLTAFFQEAQHDVEESGGIWEHIEFRHCEWDNVPDLVDGQVWVDPAVTSTDNSDSMGIQADGIAENDKVYRLYSWQRITTPEDAIGRAILKAIELGFNIVGVETDQGGDTWKSVYLRAWENLVKEKKVSEDATMPAFKWAKAGAGHGSKIERNQRMLADYERGRVIHVTGTHAVLERALKRFPNKPLDLADAAYWSWYHVAGRRHGEARSYQG